jgi:hypothetical protein
MEDEHSARPVPLQTNKTSISCFRFQSSTPVNEVSRTARLVCSAEFVSPTRFRWWQSLGCLRISLFRSNPDCSVYFIFDLLVFMDCATQSLYTGLEIPYASSPWSSFYSWLCRITFAIPSYHRVPVFSDFTYMILLFLELHYPLLVFHVIQCLFFIFIFCLSMISEVQSKDFTSAVFILISSPLIPSPYINAVICPWCKWYLGLYNLKKEWFNIGIALVLQPQMKPHTHINIFLLFSKYFHFGIINVQVYKLLFFF